MYAPTLSANLKELTARVAMLLSVEPAQARRGTCTDWLWARLVRPYIPYSSSLAHVVALVIWTKSNPQPWQNIKPGETTKMVNITGDAKRCVEPLQMAERT